MTRCAGCGRDTTGSGNLCLAERSLECWRARAERLQAERDVAVRLLRRWPSDPEMGVDPDVTDLLDRIDAKGPTP